MPLYLVSCIGNTYPHETQLKSEEDPIIPESYFMDLDLPAFIGRFKELEYEDLSSVWSVSSGSQKYVQTPNITNDLDWILRQSESENGCLV